MCFVQELGKKNIYAVVIELKLKFGCAEIFNLFSFFWRVKFKLYVECSQSRETTKELCAMTIDVNLR